MVGAIGDSCGRKAAMLVPVIGFVSKWIFVCSLLFEQFWPKPLYCLTLQCLQNAALALVPNTVPDPIFVLITGVLTAFGGGLFAFIQVVFASVVIVHHANLCLQIDIDIDK